MDEFVIIIDGRPRHWKRWPDKLVAAIATPMTLNDGMMLTPSASVGIAHGEPGIPPMTLLRNAGAALFRAKEVGRDPSTATTRILGCS